MFKKSLFSYLFLPPAAAKKQKRLYLLDEIRGTAVIAMLIFHLFFSAGEIFDYKTAHILFQFISPTEPIIAVMFIFLSGICSRLSRSNLKRGIILFFISLVINFVSVIFVPKYAIRFGVINLLSICMILYGIFEKPLLLKVKPTKGLYVCLVLFMLTWGVERRYIGIFDKYILFYLPDALYQYDYLFPLGFRNPAFHSGDYFPLMPWLFLFLSGTFFARLFKNKRLSQRWYRKHSALLSQTGQHSLLIYILHQPVIFTAFEILNYIFPRNYK